MTAVIERYGVPKRKRKPRFVATARTPGQLRRAGEKFTWWEGYRTACAVERRKQVEQNALLSLWKAAGVVLGVVTLAALYPTCTELFAGDGVVVGKQGVRAAAQVAQAVVPIIAAVGASFCFSRARRLEG